MTEVRDKITAKLWTVPNGPSCLYYSILRCLQSLMLFFCIYTSFELVKILVDWSNQSKNMNRGPPSPRDRVKAPSAKKERWSGDENDVMLVTSFFPTFTVPWKNLSAILQTWYAIFPNLICGLTVGVGWIKVNRDTCTPSAKWIWLHHIFWNSHWQEGKCNILLESKKCFSRMCLHTSTLLPKQL